MNYRDSRLTVIKINHFNSIKYPYVINQNQEISMGCILYFDGLHHFLFSNRVDNMPHDIMSLISNMPHDAFIMSPISNITHDASIMSRLMLEQRRRWRTSVKPALARR